MCMFVLCIHVCVSMSMYGVGRVGCGCVVADSGAGLVGAGGGCRLDLRVTAASMLSLFNVSCFA